MQFSNTSTQQGLVQMARNLTKLDSSQFTIEEATMYVNQALDDFVSLAIAADGDWEFDGTEHANFPIATKDIVASQQDYILNDGVNEFLAVTRVEAQNADGNWRVLQQIDRNEIAEKPLSQLFQNEGEAQYYDLLGNALFLYPTPSANITNGLKVYYKRNVTKFDSADTTEEPGIPSIFHPFIGWKAAYYKAVAEDLQNQNSLLRYVESKQLEIAQYYGKRNQVRNPNMRRAFNTFR